LDSTALDLPQVPHLPGRTPRPPEHIFERLKNAISPDLSLSEVASSATFRCGLEAFSSRYYWEAHELWEAVWMCLPPASAEKQFMRGLIQLANAGLKNRMGRRIAADRILALADAAFSEAAMRKRGAMMGLSRDDVASLRLQAALDSED
jgi:hypothetical protein